MRKQLSSRSLLKQPKHQSLPAGQDHVPSTTLRLLLALKLTSSQWFNAEYHTSPTIAAASSEYRPICFEHHPTAITNCPVTCKLWSAQRSSGLSVLDNSRTCITIVRVLR